MRTILHRIKLLAVVGCTATLLALPGRAAAVDTKDPKDQTTEERLQEQDQRIKELEQRLQNMESTAMTGTAPGPERAPTDKYNAETRETQQLMTGADLVAEKFPGSFGSWPRARKSSWAGSSMRLPMGHARMQARSG